MKALILIGGFGTRLRPLTLSVPKPLVDFANIPMLCHQLEALANVGVTEIILAINYSAQTMENELNKFAAQYKVKIICSQEEEPLGTAGPIRLAKDLLMQNNETGLFFVLNSDIICNYQLKELLSFHKAHGKEVSMMSTIVEDPSKYGVCSIGEDGVVNKFVEKPKEFIANRVNAGIYVMNFSVLEKIALKPHYLERELFPQLAEKGQLMALELQGFWMDIGQPKDYLQGVMHYLQHLKNQQCDQLAKGDNIVGNVLIHPTAKVDSDSVIGPNVTIGENCVIGKGVRLSDACILSRTVIKNHAFIRGSIIGWQSIIGQWVRIEGVSVVAEDVQIKDEVFINESFILPHKNITTSIPNAGTIVM